MPELVTILLVDDEARNLDALEAILEEPGYRLLRAQDADLALKLLLEHDVAAIVLDIKMPGVSGFELAQLIKGSRRFREIPIVFLTAYHVDDGDVLTGYGAGAVDYLTKPVDPAILRHKIAVFADLFRKTRALAELNATLERRVEERTAELAASEAALRAASEQKDLFLATLAHELRNPLAPLRTGLDVILHHPEAASMDKVLSAMNRQLDAMVRLIDDLLDVARISHGKVEVRKEPTDLPTVLERAIETAAPAYRGREQSVALEIEERVAAVVDPTRVAQIVANLLNNASKHSPPGATIRARLSRQGAHARVDVVDPGDGIPASQLGRVFDMFTKIERPGEPASSGLGVGLALSRRLAELHGGTLTAESAGEGRGATFTLLLPAESPSVPVARPASAAPPPRRADPGSRLRIVVIEDNHDSAEVISLWLETLGHQVYVAHTGPEGVELVHRERPDVVLCDIGLPGMDGVDVCRRVLAGLDEPPVMVAVTGWGTQDDRQRTQAAGFEHHLVKPVGPDDLRAMLDEIARGAGGVERPRHAGG